MSYNANVATEDDDQSNTQLEFVAELQKSVQSQLEADQNTIREKIVKQLAEDESKRRVKILVDGLCKYKQLEIEYEARSYCL